MRREERAGAAGALGARGTEALPSPLAGDPRDDGRQPLRDLHDEVQPARQRGDHEAVRRRPASAPERGDAAGDPRDRLAPGAGALRALGHGPLRVPARRRRRRGVPPRVHHARVPRLARRARAAERGDHLDPGAPVQRGDRRDGGLRRDHAAARGERLPVPRRARGRRLGADGLAPDQQPRRHGDLQPGDRAVGRASSTRPAASASTTTRTSTA